MTFQRKHDDEPVAGVARSLDTRHKPGHVVDGHGPLQHGREVVCAHNDAAAPCHDGGFAITTDGKLTPEVAPNTGAGNAMSSANAAYNAQAKCGPLPTTRSDQLVASGATGFPAKG